MHSTFSFAVMADSHIRLPKKSSGPDDYPSNQFFNARNHYVVKKINQFAPDFVVHLGDITHLIPALPDFENAMLMAKDIYRDLDSRMYVLPGNHDVGDKPNAWVPAPAVTEGSHEIFEAIWGRSYQSFDHGDCHFVLFNSLVLNSDLQRERDQRKWLESDLASNQKTGKRIFMFTHYPLYLHHPDEAVHYDNLGQPARSWLLALLEKYPVAAVFSGHTHNFFYNRYHNTDLYVLPSVAFVRPEFSEMSHIEPALEYGRNDFMKLGFTLVRVDQDGYKIEPIRTHGLTDEREESVEIYPVSLSGDRAETCVSPVGVSLRHSWASSIKLPFDNLDEFTRKQVRNDYTLLALWELGIRKLRVPISDLEDEDNRERMRALRTLGYDYTIFSVGLPSELTRDTLIHHSDLLDCWEVIIPWNLVPEIFRSIQEIRQKAGLRTVISKLDTMADYQNGPGTHFSHFPSHGFQLRDRDLIAACIERYDASKVVDGFVFRLPPDVDPWDGIETATRISKELDTLAVVHVQMPRGREGVAFVQDRVIQNLIAETIFTAHSMRGVAVYLDSLVDHDRGYYPRISLLDRRYNPRPAYYVFRNLQRALECHLSSKTTLPSPPKSPRSSNESPGFGGKVEVSPGIRSFSLVTSQFRYTLRIGEKDEEQSELSLSLEAVNDLGKRKVARMNLITGRVRETHLGLL
jgi:predicted phosphodiesterase